MPKEVQFRRGTASQHVDGAGFTGAIAEVTVDTTNNTLRVHDGVTTGGYELVGVAATQRVTNKNIVATQLTVTGIATANTFRARGGAPGALGVNNNGYGFSETGDNDSGMYSSADGQIEFYSNSQEVARFTANQNLAIGSTVETGTTSQKLQVTGGGYFSGSIGVGTTNPVGQLQVANGAVIIGAATSTGTSAQRLQVTGGGYFSGSIGVGTTNPVGQLQVANGAVIIGAATSTGTSAQRLQVTGGASFTGISSNVGIGTTNPTETLTVFGKISILQDGASNNRIILRGQPSTLWRWNIDNFGGGTNNAFRIYKEDDATAANGLVIVSIDALTSLTTVTSGLYVTGGISTVTLGSTSVVPNNSQMSFELTSNTNLRIRVRGTDGVLRATNLTLA